MSRRRIGKVGIVGSGVMGSQIACLFANSRIPVLMLDIVPTSLTPEEEKSGKKLSDRDVRNRIARENLERTLKLSPSPIADNDLTSFIEIGNMEDDIEKLRGCDWVIEAVLEDVNVKKNVFARLSEVLKGTQAIISSNTSSISLNLLSESLDEGARGRFLGTHFFNPPRYLYLLEIIPTKYTDKDIVEFISDFCARYLNREIVIAKDSPGFIANRIAVFSMLVVFNALERFDVSPSEVDEIFGEVAGRPKSAIFRTADIVGIDTLYRVIQVLHHGLKGDKMIQEQKVPDFLRAMIDKKYIGEKTKQGFYKRVMENGKNTIYEIDIKTLEYSQRRKVSDMQLEMIKREDSLEKRIKMLWGMEGKYGELFRYVHTATLVYSLRVLPEVANDIDAVDRAMRYGFGWKLGPFQTWDIIGTNQIIESAQKYNIPLPENIKDIGSSKFYTRDASHKTLFFDLETKTYRSLPEENYDFNINVLKNKNKIWGDAGASFFHWNDDVGILLIHSKGNTIDDKVGIALQRALKESNDKFGGLVICGYGDHFCMGANLLTIYALASAGDYDELSFMIHQFQQINMSIKYSPVPVVALLHGYVFGGGCEIALHTSFNVAFIDTYMGLVEAGMGLLPAGGGIKELLVRFTSMASSEGILPEIYLMEFIKRVATASVSLSAYDAKKNMYLRESDLIVFSRKHQLETAVKLITTMHASGYRPPVRKKIKLLGKDALGVAYAAIDSLYSGKRITEHEKKVATKIAEVFCGGDISEPVEVDEQYVLDREREAFLSLCGEPKTLERMATFLKTGKVIRN